MAQKHRFMVVDDELIVRESLSAWLEKEGAVVDRAESGEQALDCLGDDFFIPLIPNPSFLPCVIILSTGSPIMADKIHRHRMGS